MAVLRTSVRSLAGGGEATDGYVGGATDRAEPHAIGAWMAAMLEMDGQLDFRPMMLLNKALKIDVLIVTRENSILRDIDRRTTRV